MADYNTKQIQIEQRKQTAIANYLVQWSRMIEMWRDNSDEVGITTITNWFDPRSNIWHRV